MAVTSQPRAGMAPVYPPAIEYLTRVDMILIKQRVELLEAFTGFETQNQYDVLNSMGQPIFTALEDSSCCTRCGPCSCGPSRPLTIRLMSGVQEVASMSRPLRCTSCFWFCCLQVLDIFSPPGTRIGWVKQNCYIIWPSFSIYNAQGTAVLHIQGPCCQVSLPCCSNVEFQVMSADGHIIGKISKQWSGLLREAFTDADNYGISFPQNLDPNAKLLLIGAALLIDYMYFEETDNPRRKQIEQSFFSNRF